MVVDGRWAEEDRWIQDGAFVRPCSAYGDDLGPEVLEALVEEPGRYHLVASLSCPWSHRALIVRALKSLAGAVPLRIAGGPRVEGYAVAGGSSWRVPGSDRNIVHLHQLYTLSDPGYTGRATLPLLWDSRTRRIVSNESAKIMRGFDAARTGGLDFTLVPDDLRDDIDRLNDLIHHNLANAVYRAGLAQRQEAYGEAVALLFATLDELEARLRVRRFLFGSTITETDWRLFATLVRFDAVYFTHFRCSRRRLIDYPHLWAYARDLHAWRGIAETVDLTEIRRGYYLNDGVHNPFSILGVAPECDWSAAHGREAMGPARVVLATGEAVAVDPATLVPSNV